MSSRSVSASQSLEGRKLYFQTLEAEVLGISDKITEERKEVATVLVSLLRLLLEAFNQEAAKLPDSGFDDMHINDVSSSGVQEVYPEVYYFSDVPNVPHTLTPDGGFVEVQATSPHGEYLESKKKKVGLRDKNIQRAQDIIAEQRLDGLSDQALAILTDWFLYTLTLWPTVSKKLVPTEEGQEHEAVKPTELTPLLYLLRGSSDIRLFGVYDERGEVAVIGYQGWLLVKQLREAWLRRGARVDQENLKEVQPVMQKFLDQTRDPLRWFVSPILIGAMGGGAIAGSLLSSLIATAVSPEALAIVLTITVAISTATLMYGLMKLLSRTVDKLQKGHHNPSAHVFLDSAKSLAVNAARSVVVDLVAPS